MDTAEKKPQIQYHVKPTRNWFGKIFHNSDGPIDT